MGIFRRLRDRRRARECTRAFWAAVAVRNGWARPPAPLAAGGSRVVSFAVGVVTALGIAAVFAIDAVVGAVVLVSIAATSNWKPAR